MTTDTVSSTGEVILIVDDGDVFRERLARAFRSRGYVALTAANYDDAMAIVKQQTPDLAVVDLRMPGPSGLQLIRDLKELSPETEVLLLTGYGSIATAVDAMRLGAANCIPKPANAEDILAAFRRASDEALETEAVEHDTPSLAQAEWEHIHRVLAESGGNISQAARRLGIHRRSLQRKLKKLSPDAC